MTNQMKDDVGRVASPNRLSSDDGARLRGLHPSGFDPARGAEQHGCSLLAAVGIGIFCGLWAVGLWLNPDTARWARSLPLGLGTPVFVLGGTATFLLTLCAPVAVWALLTRDSDRSGEAIETAQTGSTAGESAGPKDIAQGKQP